MQQDKPKPGMRLGNYTLMVKLGEGIFSETWLAEHTYLESKEICLKIFTNSKYSNQLKKQKFLNIVKDVYNLAYIEDYDPTSYPPYIAEEVVRGRSLRQLLREKKRFSAKTAFAILAKTIKAIKKMHELNIAHLDIRPEHIIIDDKGNLKVLDYLLGKVTTFTLVEYYNDYLTQKIPIPKPLMRSLLYKSKRQRTGQEMGIEADIFALGILLFEMSTGNYPSRNAASPSQLVPDLPRKVDRIYARCCGRDEEMIYPSCKEIIESIHAEEDINDIVSGLPGVQLIEKDRKDSAVVCVKSLAGNKHYVDGKNITLLSRSLDHIMATQLKYLAFDFSKIDYINSSGIGFLVNFSDRVQKTNGATVMFNVDNKVLTILSALGLEKVLQIVENVDQAKEYLQKFASQQSQA